MLYLEGKMIDHTANFFKVVVKDTYFHTTLTGL